MAKIRSGATTDELTVDPTSKAARVTQYGALGTPVYGSYVGAYMTKIEIVPTTLNAGTTYFSMRNLGTKDIHIHRILLYSSFSGVNAATRSIFEIERFTTATPTAGTAQTAVKKATSFPTSNVTDIRFAPGGLTTTNVVFGDPFTLVNVTNQLSYQTAFQIEYPEEQDNRLILAANEGLCIRANTAIVAGAALLGSIDWDEL
jgi:hypothetical protein